MVLVSIIYEMEFYVYAYLDPRKVGNFEYPEICFGYEPFYIGKGKGRRSISGIKDKKNKLKRSKIDSILNEGLEPIIVKIKQGLEENEAFLLETQIILSIGRIVNGEGPLSNLTDGGEGTSGYRDFRHSKEWKNKLSKSIIQRDLEGNFIKEYDSVKSASEETGIIRQNISCNLTGRYKTAGGFIWEYKDKENVLQGHLVNSFQMPKHSEETKKKMSDSAKKGEDHHMKNKMGKNNKFSKKVVQKSKDGNIIKIWDCMKDASREIGVPVSHISRCCSGNIKSARGFVWELYL